MTLANHQLINQTSGAVEWYTPPEILAAARDLLGAIDLDPASSPAANQLVRAARIFTIADNGLSRPWRGRVWLNHPYGRAVNAAWVDKLIGEYERGQVIEALCITFASTGTEWFRPLLDYPQCYLFKRVRFIQPNGCPGDSPTKSSVITYLGNRPDAFRAVFECRHGLGKVKI